MFAGVETKERRDKTLTFATGLCACALAAVVIYGAQSGGSDFAKTAAAISVGAMVAGACLVAGGLVGFIFGIPRTAQAADTGRADSGGTGSPYTYTPNTNLEQISDWLTKILVGVGLSQMAVIGAKLSGAADFVAPAFQNSGSDRVFALALITYCLITGFILGYVSTRLLLPQALREADQELQETLVDHVATLETVQRELTGNAAEDISQKRAEAEHRLGTMFLTQSDAKAKLVEYARKYEHIRRALPSSGERTYQMSKIVAQIRALALSLDYGAREISGLFNTAKEGDRIAALSLLQVVRAPDCLDIVIEAIGRSKTPFEQYHGLRAAVELLDVLADDGRRKIAGAVKDQRSSGPRKYIMQENADRWALSEQILRALGE